MRILIALTLTIIYLSIGYSSYKKYKDIFSPLTFFSFYQFIRYVPNILIKTEEHNFLITDESLILLFAYQILFICAVLIGYKLVIKKQQVITNSQSTERINLYFVFFLFILGLTSRIVTIQQSGGIYHILNSPATAYLGLSSGTGYLSLVSYLSVFGIVFFLYYSRKQKSLMILTIAMISIYVFTYAIYSSRSPILELFLLILFSYNFLIKKIKLRHLLRVKYFIIGAIMLFFLMALPYFRSGDVTNIFNFEVIGLIFENGFKSFFDQFSYVGRDAFVYNYFNSTNRWYGQPFLNLIYGPIPSSIFTNKPALDDGIYLNHLLQGFYITPNTGRSSFQVSYSIPFSTQSSLYANFGLFGVLIGGVLMGYLYKISYQKLIKFKKPLYVFIYFLVIYQLEISSLSIVQTLIPLFVYIISYQMAKNFPVFKKGDKLSC